MAAANFRALEEAEIAEFGVFGIRVKAQYNPCRIVSSTAEVDAASIAARPCFLCVPNRPKEQFHIGFEAAEGRLYNVQVNPFPIFPRHLVLARAVHVPQSILPSFPDMLLFAREYPDMLVFYNGPASGASAPDHHHFQACPRHSLPLEDAADAFLAGNPRCLVSDSDAAIFLMEGYTNGVFVLRSGTVESMDRMFRRLYGACDIYPGDSEPRLNVYCYEKDGGYRAIVVLRTEIRSHHYYAEGAEHLTMSPGAADMAGFFVVPEAADFPKLNREILEAMLAEVTVSEEEQQMVCDRLERTQQTLEVGIMRAEEISFEMPSLWPGIRKVTMTGGRISYGGELYDTLEFPPSPFVLHNVTIGIDFHWQQDRDLQYAGALRFVIENGRIAAVNVIGVEDYLLSVISSEMKSTSSLELLKAHSVISRSWVMARMEDRRAGKPGVPHTLYDVCADDHCQRYQGITMASGPDVRRAIHETWGQVLRYGGELCDARYSKCCGGTTELFSSCWEDVDFPYLQPVRDNDGGRDFCDCEDSGILAQVLNDYDLETKDFYSWEVRYTRSGLSGIIRRKTGKDIGDVLSLVPLERGASGRIVRLLVKGSAGEMTLGKELAIRRALSDSHLKSSAFEVREEDGTFVLQGKGWGHGVGLCQIGAAVMAARGYDYKSILKHYYTGAEIV